MKAVEFPAFLKLGYENDGRAGTQMLADLDRALSSAEGRFREFSGEAKRQLEQALSISRNDVGALDLNVPQMRAAAEAQQARAIAAREIARATALAAREEGDYSTKTNLAIKATQALAREEERAAQEALSHARALEQLQERLNRQASATDVVTSAQRRGNDASRAVAESMRGQRVAFIQTGQQLQDMAIQFQMGTRASTIFAQQIPQLLTGLTSLEGSSNRTTDKIGRFASLLSGPWSLAVVAGAAGLGYLVDKLLASDEASSAAGKSTLSLTDALAKAAIATAAARTALEEYNAEQDRARDQTEDLIKLNLASAEARLKEAIATRQQLQAELELAKQRAETAGRGQSGEEAKFARMGAGLAVGRAQGRLDENNRSIGELETTLRNLRIQDATRDAKAAIDPVQAVNNKYDDMAAAAKRAAAGNEALSKSLKGTLIEIERNRKAELDRMKTSRRDRPGREDTRVEAFGMPLPSGSFRSGSKFGAQRDGYKHQGVDLPVAVGTPVFATQDGQVIFASNAGAYGNLVKINHGAGTETRYGHLSRFAVQDGASVKKGDIIGYSGGKPGTPGAGRSTGAHLHYEVRVNGKPVDPTKGAFPFDASKVAEEAEKARKDLEDFGNKSAEKISRINESFDEQPRLIDRANQATRELDKTIAELEERKPIGWEQMVEDAKDAKLTIEDAIVRPLKEMREEGEKNIAVQRLLTAGREDEAEALERIWDYEKRIGPLKAEQKQEIFEQVRYERLVNEELQRRQEIIGAYLDATRSVKQELVSIFSGEGSFANLGKIFRNLQGQMLVEKLFGNAFRDFDKWVKGQSGLADSVDYFSDQTTEAGNAAQEFAAALDGARMQIAMPGISMGGAQAGLGLGGIAAMFGGAANDNGVAGEIVATGKRLEKDSVMSLSPERYFSELSKTIVGPALNGLDAIFGTKFFGKMQGVLSGAMNGYLTGGPAGGVIGALQGIPGLPKGISNELTKALKGSQTGTMVAGVGNALGIKLSSTGAQIGGAIGAMIPIPGGDIIGSIAGGILGSLFGKRPRGAGTVSNSGITASANDAGITGSLNDTGSNLQDAIKNIADALGASVGAYSIGIGRYKDYYQVSRSANDPKLGNSYFGRDSKNAVYDGLDAEAAMAAAIGAILAQGAIKGISAASQKILSSAASKDLQAAIEKAVLIESIPKRLKALTDPVGAAIDELNKDFEKMVAALREGGATAEQFAEAQKLYELERAEAVKRAVQQVTGSLQSLYDSLTVGNDALSLRDRKSAALGIYNPLAARVAAGDKSAYDAFADAAKALIDIERQISGSQSGYFDLVKQVTDLTKSRLDAETRLILAANASDSPFSNSPTATANDNQGVIDAIGGLGTLLIDNLGGQLSNINRNIGSLIQVNLAVNSNDRSWSEKLLNY